MPLSLHAAYVPSALQMLGTAKHLVDTAEQWCDDHGHDHADITGARIVDENTMGLLKPPCAGGQADEHWHPNFKPPPKRRSSKTGRRLTEKNVDQVDSE